LGTAEAALDLRNSISLRNSSLVFFILNLSRIVEKCQILRKHDTPDCVRKFCAGKHTKSFLIIRQRLRKRKEKLTHRI
jgi:hypothetical protein